MSFISKERKIKLSIRVKIIAVIATIVLTSLGLYLAVALNLFNKDKSAYVFESGLTTAETVSTQVSNYLQRLIKDSLNIYNLLVDRQLKPEQMIGVRDYRDVFPVKPSKSPDAVEKTILELVARLGKVSVDKRDALKIELAAAYLEKSERLYFDGRSTAKNQTKSDRKNTGTEFKKPLQLAVQLFNIDSGENEKENVPVSADQLFVLGQIYKLLSDYDNAESNFRQLADRHKTDPRIGSAAFLLAESLFAKRDYSGATEQYSFVMQRGTGKTAVFSLYKAIWASSLSGNSKQTLVHLEKARQLGNALPEVLRADILKFAVQVFAEAKNPDAAAKFYGKVPSGAAFIAAVKSDIELINSGASAGRGATNLLESRRLLRSLFFGDPDIVEFSVYEGMKDDSKTRSKTKPARLARLVNKDYLSESNLTEYYLDRVDEEKPINFSTVSPGKPLFLNSSIKGGMGLITLVRQDPLTNRYLVVRAKMDRFLNVFTQNKVYTTFMISTGGDLFAHKDARLLVEDVNMLEEKYVTDIVKSGNKVGVREIADRTGTDMIIAYTDVGIFNLMVFSEIKKSKAFLAARELTKKSMYFAVFLISIAIMTGILFAKSLTTPIDVLFKGTKIIAAGDFKTRVSVKSKDEIGVLADSFNYMAGRIVSLLEQEKDKVRMEEELKVAKLVQDSFFPANKLMVGNLDIAAFYTPSSECGGDWWGMLRNGRKTLIMIGDATGHGVPAALITATAASCSITIQEMGRIHPDLLDSPAQILGLLNKAVYGAAQGKILMTFFVCIIDPDTMTATYSNASHNPPYLYKFDDAKEPSKKDLTAMMEAVGYRLGHKLESTYEDAQSKLAADDMIVFFTDGFVECTNPGKEEYGNRKFIKSILKYMKARPEDACDGIVKDARDYFAEQPLADDLTMVVAKILPEVVSEKSVA